MRMSPRRKAMARKMVEDIKARVYKAIAGVPSSPFGHAFMYASVSLMIDGEKVQFRHLIGYVCAADFSEVERRVEAACPEVSMIDFKLD